MVKKKDESISPPVSSADTPPFSENTKIGGEESKGYTIGQWAGKEQYRCKQCEFDTLDMDVMLDHLIRMHSAPVSNPSDQPAVFPTSTDRSGEAAQDIYDVDLKEVHDGKTSS